MSTRALRLVSPAALLATAVLVAGSAAAGDPLPLPEGFVEIAEPASGAAETVETDTRAAVEYTDLEPPHATTAGSAAATQTGASPKAAAAVPDADAEAPPATPEHLAGISGDFQNNFLNLLSKGLSSLKAGDFDGLTNLKRLRLTRNSLSTLPAGIFDGLTGLLALDLNYNQLTTLRPSVFDRLTKLKYLYLNNNSLAVLPDGVFRNNLALATHRLDGNTGANFTPTADAGTDQTVATGAEVTLSGTATGPWAENDIAWHWRQVDGPYSDTVVQGGVQREGQTATFTAPATATVMHFRLAAIPKVLVESRPEVSGAPPPPVSIRERGIFDGFAWVTITVEGGQGSPQEDAQPAQVEEAACVSDALLAEVRTAAGETWRTSPGHATSSAGAGCLPPSGWTTPTAATR